MSLTLKLTRHLARTFSRTMPLRNRQSTAAISGRPRVLVIGIYMASVANHAKELVRVFGSGTSVSVTQRWVCMTGNPPSKEVDAVTVRRLEKGMPKWQLVNELVTPTDLQEFDYFLVADDDVLLADDFADRFFAEQQSLDFALAQPARTWRSYTDHPIVRRRLFMRARQTNFVETGPIVSFRRDLFEHVYPFSMESPMGWGYDLTWPVIARKHGLAIGIVDGIPVDHSLRARNALYDWQKQAALMGAYLSTRPHVREPEINSTKRKYR